MRDIRGRVCEGEILILRGGWRGLHNECEGVFQRQSQS